MTAKRVVWRPISKWNWDRIVEMMAAVIFVLLIIVFFAWMWNNGTQADKMAMEFFKNLK